MSQTIPAETPAQHLVEIIRSGLEAHAKQATALQLGDRSTYVGMSDIGAMQECPRAAVLRKCRQPACSPKNDTVSQRADLRRQLVLQRGHWLEDGIAKALQAHHFHMLPQVELCVPDGAIPLKAHMDFVLAEGKPHPVVRILELKSTEHLPAAPSSAYATQIHGQISLLAAYWNAPVFAVRDAEGHMLSQGMTFPQLCKHHFTLALPQSCKHMDMQGWLLCISMTDAKAFGPYLPDGSIVADCLRHAANLWQYMQDINEGTLTDAMLPTVHGFSPRCSWCEQAAGCPKFAGENQPEWADTLQELAELKAKKDSLQGQISAVEESVKYACVNGDALGKWFTAGDYRFRVAQQKGRKTLNKDKLLEELIPFMGQEDAAQLLANCETEGEAFLRLYTQSLS